MMKKISITICSICFLLFSPCINAQKKKAENKGYFEIKVIHFSNQDQEKRIDSFLQYHFVPYLHDQGLNNIGVFKALANDTASDKKMYVLIPFADLKKWEKYLSKRKNDPAISTTSGYANGANDKPSFTRTETIFLTAFPFMPPMSVPALSAPKSERVYELRSYESASEKLHVNKVHMFNEGGEIDIFSKLGFNAVFYGSVIYGAKAPNLMYMTSFNNMKSRQDHWSAFGGDPEWKILSAKKEYQKNVSRIEITFLRPTDYSDL